MDALFKIFIGALGIWIGYKLAVRRKMEKVDYVTDKKGVVKDQIDTKNENMIKVRELVNKKDKITNNDIENSLGVSDSTAERYLAELEKEGVIKQIGEGRYTYYIKI